MIKSTTSPVVVGTRGSRLALWQAEYVVARLRARFPDRRFAVKHIRTRGDTVQGVALSMIGTRGIFVKELQSELLAGEIDLAIHSLKDLPSEEGSGLALAAVSPREDPRDVLVSHDRLGLAELPPGARLGTSSPRRAAQLRALRPDLVIENIRGNVDTRVRRALAGDFDGVVLAAAGLRRLGLEENIAEYVPLAVMTPAPGQGIIGIEARADDLETIALASAVDDLPVHQAARAERAFVRALGGGCYTPLGAYAWVRDEVLHLQGILASVAGDRVLRDEVAGEATMPEALGTNLAARLYAGGGGEILAEIEHAEG